jgi:hypothetical protein
MVVLLATDGSAHNSPDSDQHIEDGERRGDGQNEASEDQYSLSQAAKSIWNPVTPGTMLPRPSVPKGLGDADSLGEMPTLGNRTEVLVLPTPHFRLRGVPRTPGRSATRLHCTTTITLVL